MVLDSNIIIYMANPENAFLVEWLQQDVYISAITQVEVLGYHNLHPADEEKFKQIFHQTTVLPVGSSVIERAVEFRKTKKMSLGDSIIAATAYLNNLPLLTRNTTDFDHIEGFVLINPFET